MNRDILLTGCSWIELDPKDPLAEYCNAPKREGSWCCPKHHKIAYTGIPEPRRKDSPLISMQTHLSSAVVME